MALTFASLNEEATISGITLEGNVTERLAVYMEDMGVQFTQTVGVIHVRTVFQILIRLLRLCPVDTGRLRGSWTTFMEALNFGGFQKWIQTPSLAGGVLREGEKRTGFSDLECKKGQALGAYILDPAGQQRERREYYHAGNAGRFTEEPREILTPKKPAAKAPGGVSYRTKVSP